MKHIHSALALSIVSVLSACGGSDDDGTTSNASNYNVKAIDGYLNGAFVWLDLNADGQFNTGEPSAETSGLGDAILSLEGVTDHNGSPIIDASRYPVIVRAIRGKTVDIGDGNGSSSTPVTEDYIMSAPAGQTAVTPFSTLVHVKVNNGDTLESAKQQVATSLGIDEDKLLGDFYEDGSETTQQMARIIVSAKVLPTTTEQLSQNLMQEASDHSVEDRLSQLSTIVASTEFDSARNLVIVGGDGSLEIADSHVDDDSDSDGIPDAIDHFVDADARPEGYVTSWDDIDGDGIGDNMDPDIDGDGISNDEDVMPYDPLESKDNDGDGIGDYADKDDDNDGVLDIADAAPFDPTVSTNENTKLRAFFESNSVAYSLWGNHDFDDPELDREAFDLDVVDGSPTASFSQSEYFDYSDDGVGTWQVLSDSQSDILLVESGWVEVGVDASLIFDGINWVVTVGSDHDSHASYTAFGSVVSLSGKPISTIDTYWPHGNTNLLFSEGAEAINFSMVTQAVNYWLTDQATSQIGSFHASTADVISSQSVSTSISSDTSLFLPSIKGVFISDDTFMEFVETDTENLAFYYEINAPTTARLLVNNASQPITSTWKKVTVHGADIIEFTLPKIILNHMGDNQPEQPTLILSDYNNSVHIGWKDNHIDDGVIASNVTFVNETALDDYQASLRPEFECTLQNTDSATYANYLSAVESCGGMLPITTSFLVDNSFYRTRSNGSSREYFFNDDGSATVVKDEDLADTYQVTWVLNNNLVTITYDDGAEWTWALVDQHEVLGSFKFYDTWSENGVVIQEIWSKEMQLKANNELCIFSDESISDYEQFESSVEAYRECRASAKLDLLASDINTLILADSWDDGNASSVFVMSDDGTLNAIYDGVWDGQFNWALSEDSILDVSSQSDGFVEFKMAFLAESDDGYLVADYWDGDDRAWLYKIDQIDASSECTINSDDTWGDNGPTSTSSYSQFDDQISACINTQNFDSRVYTPRVAEHLTNNERVLVLERRDGEDDTIVFKMADASGQSGDALVNDDGTWLRGSWQLLEDNNDIRYRVTIMNDTETYRITFASVDVVSESLLIKTFEQYTGWSSANVIDASTGAIATWTVRYKEANVSDYPFDD
ncbi:thrombospondin type 3 repeat-containing protein [Vibrio sp. E150_011]